ncbi:MAG: hypothetical protein AAF993_18265 [Pseudomonadota bacterium]
MSNSTPSLTQLELNGQHKDVQVVQTAVSRGDNFAGPALEKSSTMAGSFDYSYFFVLCLGMAGLVWMRRQSQSL